MTSVLKAYLSVIDQPDKSFVDQRCGLKDVTLIFAAHMLMGEPVQFVVNEWHKLFTGVLIAITPGLKQLSDFV